MNEISFERLVFGVDDEARAAPHLVQAMVELTYGCNLRCVHCYNPTHDAQDELRTEAVLRILDELAHEGCLRVGFTGGELFVRRDTFDILRHAKRLGMILTILTNATMITSKIADRLAALDPHQVDVSVYGASAETYETVTRVPGSFLRFLSGLDRLVERHVRVLLKLVLLTVNVHERRQMQELAMSRNLRYQMATDVHPRVDGSIEPLAYRLSPAQAFEVWRESAEPIPSASLTARGESLAAFDGRCIPAGGVAPPSNTPGILGRRALPAGRLARLGATPDVHHGLLTSGGSQMRGASRAKAEEPACGFDGRVFHCRCGKSNVAVTPHGRLNLCLSVYHPRYDLTRGSLKDGWKQLVDLVASARPGPAYECNRCSLTEHCSRGVGDSWLATGQFDNPCMPHYRELAERKASFLRER